MIILIRIGLDYGHGGKDSGATSGGYKEKDLALQIGRKLTNKLKSHNNISVFESRQRDMYVSLENRANYFNKNNVDVVISLHLNSFNNPSVNGVECYHFPNSSRGKTLANNIHNQIITDKIYKTDRKVKTANFYVLRKTKAPTTLLELGFITNTYDRNIAINQQDKIVNSIYKGILKHFNIRPITDTPKPSNNNTFYRVVAGSYKEKSNADKQLKKLKKLGIDNAFITTYKK